MIGKSITVNLFDTPTALGRPSPPRELRGDTDSCALSYLWASCQQQSAFALFEPDLRRFKHG